MGLGGPEWIEAASTRLSELLDAAADDRTRAHWERYLKGAASFRGVPMAGVRTAMRTVWREERLADRDTDALLGLTDRWFHGAYSEDKLAAVLLLAEQASERLDTSHLPALAAPLEAGAIGDWNVCDWYATKTVHTFVAADVAGRARGGRPLVPRSHAVAAPGGRGRLRAARADRRGPTRRLRRHHARRMRGQPRLRGTLRAHRSRLGAARAVEGVPDTGPGVRRSASGALGGGPAHGARAAPPGPISTTLTRAIVAARWAFP